MKTLWNIAKGTSILIVITVALYGVKGAKRETPGRQRPNWGDGWGHDV